MSTFLINYHVGDIVDIKANAAQQKGMPHKYYHGYVHFIIAKKIVAEIMLDTLDEPESCTTSPLPPSVSSFTRLLATAT